MHRYVEDIRAEYDTNDTARTEAIKEFAQLVKENLDDFYHTDDGSLLDTVSMVDLLVKEMTEDQKSDPKEIH